MIDASKIIYSINIEDVQNVAEEEFGRKLTKRELRIIEDKLSDYIDWYNAIDIAIQNEILHHRQWNKEFMVAYAQIINKFTLDFMNEFCIDGKVDWKKLEKFNSGKES